MERTLTAWCLMFVSSKNARCATLHRPLYGHCLHSPTQRGHLTLSTGASLTYLMSPLAQSRPQFMKTQCENRILFSCLPLTPPDLWICLVTLLCCPSLYLEDSAYKKHPLFLGKALPLSLCSAWK